MIVAMLAMVALISLAGVTSLSVRSGLTSGGNERFSNMALYAAESGAVVAMEYLRQRVHSTDKWSSYVNPNNDPIESPIDLPGNDKRPGEVGNLFSPQSNLWYKVEILNNRDDPGFPAGNDDGRVIIRATGHGPGNTMAQVEWEVRQEGAVGQGAPCGSYAQGNVNADGAGRNDCISSNINSSDVGVFVPAP